MKSCQRRVMKRNTSKNVLVLLSGGIDSTACINFYKELSFRVRCLHIDYGQLARRKELSAVKRVCKYYEVGFEKIIVSGFQKFSGGLVNGRNLFLISTAFMKHEQK